MKLNEYDLKVGMKTKSGYVLTEKIETFERLWEVLNTDKSLFCRHRMYPTAFFFSWQLRTIHIWLKRGRFYTAYKTI